MAFGTVIRTLNPATSLLRDLDWSGVHVLGVAASGLGWLGSYNLNGQLIHSLPTMINGRGGAFIGRSMLYTDIGLDIVRHVILGDEVSSHDMVEPDSQANGLAWTGVTLLAACTATSNTYRAVDPRTGTVIRSWAWALGGTILDIMFCGGYLYATSSNGNMYQLRFGGPAIRTVVCPAANPWGMAWDGRTIWLECAGSGFIYQMMVN